MHKRKLSALLLAALALAAITVVATGCGGGGDSTSGGSDTGDLTTSDESTGGESTDAESSGGEEEESEASSGEAPTKAVFIKEADEICSKTEDESNEEIVEFAKQNNIEIEKEEPSTDQQLEIYEEVVLPKLNEESDEIAALTPPEGEEDAVEDLIDTLNEEIGDIEDDPGQLTEANSSPLSGASEKAKAFGLKVCGQ